MHVDTVGDDAAGEAVAGKRRAGGAQFTVTERAHGIEQVGDAGQPRGRSAEGIGVGLAVAGGDDDAASDERRDTVLLHALRR